MTIETKRLILHPLTAEQLKLLVCDLPALERALACRYEAEPLRGDFLTIVQGQLAITENDPQNYPWHSFWLLLRKADRVVVGAADFKDVPNAAQEVEIGYGLGKAFEHQGYMTEAVRAMCRWALQQSGVCSIRAETERDGLASQGILRRCGFCEESRGETIWWRLRPRCV